LISTDVINEIYKPQIIKRPTEKKEFAYQSYGLGWFIDYYRNNLMIHHGGSSLGCQSLISFMPKEEMGVVVLCNKLCTLTEAISYSIYDKLLDLEPINWNLRKKVF